MSDETESYCPCPHADERPRHSSRESVLCQGHVARLQRTLEELGRFDAEADQASYDSKVARHDGAPLTGTGERPMPIDPRIADLRVDARDILTAWCRLVAEERHLSPPRVRLTALCAFLERNLAWVVGQDWIDEFAAETFDLGSKAHGILRPSGNRQFPVGECVETVDGERCPGTMWALLTPSDSNFMAAAELVCDQCECRVHSADWVQYGHRLKKMEAGEAA